jgi:uncharacterized protein (TIGR02757 family)
MNLKDKLEYHYKAFGQSRISPDPLEFLHRYKDNKDIEITGFIASVFAYGNIKQIMRISEMIFLNIGKNPYRFLVDFNRSKEKLFSGIKHRFYNENDIKVFFLLLSKAIKRFGSMEALFMKGYDSNDKNLKKAISSFSTYFLSEIEKKYTLSSGIKFMFPLPEKGSACKRMNLFLRWMIRKDQLDTGLWSEIPSNKLVIPVDTHIAKICGKLNLTKRKNPDWLMAEEITENLKKYDPEDPVKYDFALCHIGMRKMEF